MYRNPPQFQASSFADQRETVLKQERNNFLALADIESLFARYIYELNGTTHTEDVVNCVIIAIGSLRNELLMRQRAAQRGNIMYQIPVLEVCDDVIRFPKIASVTDFLRSFPLPFSQTGQHVTDLSSAIIAKVLSFIYTSLNNGRTYIILPYPATLLDTLTNTVSGNQSVAIEG